MGDRFRRLTRFIGAEAAGCLRARSALVVGCGALGSAAASYLVRAGIGRLRLVDFDVVHPTNLGDQCLYSESQASALLPKVEAAAQQLALFNSHVQIEAWAIMFDRDNALQCSAGMDVIVDGADNLETKYLLNDVAVATKTPWVYGGCAGGHGTVLAVIPRRTPCLRCIWPVAPPIGGAATCSSMGLLPTTPGFVAALQVTEALKILVGRADEVCEGPLFVDLWHGLVRDLSSPAFKRNDCPACGRGELVYLEGDAEVPDHHAHGLAFGL